MGMEGFFPKKAEVIKAENKEESFEVNAKDLRAGDVVVGMNGEKEKEPLEFLGRGPDNENSAYLAVDVRPVGKTSMFSINLRPEDKIEVIRK